MRVAIYARFSSQMQREASIEDQERLCLERAEREAWSVVARYADRAISGASMLRPGLQALLAAASAAQIDLVLAEALDRLSRDHADIAALFKQLSFAGVRIITLAEGEISELHVGLKGTMNQLFLKDLAAKTRRGLRGRVEAGKSGGGNSYGYDVVRGMEPDGTPITGQRTINEPQAEIVRRIFAEFADGFSPKAIALRLNAEGIPGARGGRWRDTAIRGHKLRGTGLINNELYIGRLVWNRQRYLKDPATGRRVSRRNPAQDLIVTEVPELRIVDDALWHRVKARQGEIESEPRVAAMKATRFWERRRKTHLLTGLLRCGACGGGFAAVGKDYLACSASRKLGTCDQRQSLRRSVLEEAVLDLLRTRLMQPDAVAEFIAAFGREMNVQRGAEQAQQAKVEAEKATLRRKLDGLYDAIAEGLRTPGLKEKLENLEAQLDALNAAPVATAPTTVRLHPNLSEIYRRKVSALAETLADPDIGTPALEAARGLIEQVTVQVGTDGITLELLGALTAMLDLAQPGAGRDLAASSVKVVAGVGFEPTTFRL
jgi:site-specific DNA recombinase